MSASPNVCSTSVTPQTSLSLNFAVGYLQTGQCVCYARAAPIYCGDTISLIFESSVDPFPEMDRNVVINAEQNADPRTRQVAYWFSRDIEERVRKQVKKGEIDLYLPDCLGPLPYGEVKEPWAKWTAIIPVIGSMCRRIFPNLIAKESSFNIHVGDVCYNADLHLTSNDLMMLFFRKK